MPSDSSPKSSNKVALIAVAINIVLTVFIINTIGVIASGIYLGLAKNTNTATIKIFFVVSALFFALYDLSRGFYQYDDPVQQMFTLLFSSILLAAVPLGVAFVVKKIANR